MLRQLTIVILHLDHTEGEQCRIKHHCEFPKLINVIILKQFVTRISAYNMCVYRAEKFDSARPGSIRPHYNQSYRHVQASLLVFHWIYSDN